MQLPEKFQLKQHNHPQCFIVLDENGTEIAFLKYPRTSENYKESLQELFNELAVTYILRQVGAEHLDSTLEKVNLKYGIVSQYCHLDWSNKEGLEIINLNQVPLYFAIDVWTGQRDRQNGKNEHIGLLSQEENRYLLAPLDNGHSLVGFPGGHQGSGEDITEDKMQELFWSATDHSYDKKQLEEAIQKCQELDIQKLLSDVDKEIQGVLVSKTAWSLCLDADYIEHKQKVEKFLTGMRDRLPDLFEKWWAKYKSATVNPP